MGGIYLRRLASFFLAGLATLLPVVISIYLVYWIFSAIDSLLEPIFIAIFGHAIPGLGFVSTIIIVIIVGLFSKNILGKKLLYWTQALLYRTPIVGKIYSTVRRITNSFFSTGKNAFRQVALVEFPRKGIFSIGFITNEDLPYLGEEAYSVFIPTTPNPTSGWFIIVPKEDVQILDISVEQGIETVISAGMIANGE